jgi:hypothetical protein
MTGIDGDTAGSDATEGSPLLRGVPMDRRAFLRRAAVGSAVAAPVVASFSMSGLGAAYAQTPGLSGTGGSNQLELCGPNGPYGFGIYPYSANQSPMTVRPDLFGANGVCEQLGVPNWWTT